MQLAATLFAAQSRDLKQRNDAEARLQEWEGSHLPQFMHALAQELASEDGRDENSRQLAGLHLKNLLTGREAKTADEKKLRWLRLDAASARAPIKALCLAALQSPSERPARTSAQVVAKIGAIEVPEKQWPELLDELVGNMSKEVPNGDLLKTATLEALGYLCEDLEDESVEPANTNKILTAIVDGMHRDRVEVVRVAGATALLNALVFTRHNFEVSNERTMIMQVVCTATQSGNEKLRVVAFESLARIASLYYDRLGEYMPTLFQLTLEAIKKDTAEQVSMMAIEFWSTLCEEELELLDEEIEDEHGSRGTCARYVQQAAQHHLVPALLECALLRQDEDADTDTWNLAAAGAVCLALVAQTVSDEVIAPVLQFFEQSIMQADWRRREAAIMAFGQIVDGPKLKTLAPYVKPAVPALIDRLRDDHTLVKDTAAWTLARICEYHAASIPAECLEPLAASLVAAIDDRQGRVVAQAAFAIHNLAQACDESASSSASTSGSAQGNHRKPATNALSPYFEHFLRALLKATDRPDWTDSNLRVQAYEAVNMLVQSHAQDTRPVVVNLLRYIISKLVGTFQMQVLSQDDKEERDQHQSALCSVIQVITRALDKEVAQMQDEAVQVLLQVLTNQNAVASEEAFMALGAIAAAIESNFEQYLNEVIAHVVRGLQNYADWQVCNAAVGCTGDICRALEARVLPVCDQLVQCLLADLQNRDLNRQVKPNVLSCFGDVALAIGGSFDKYLEYSLQMLDQAGQTPCPPDADDDMIDYLNVLREGILEGYTGIVQGLKDGNKAGLIIHTTALGNIFAFLARIADDFKEGRVDEAVVVHAIGLVGDLADVTPRGPASAFFNSPPVQLLMRDHTDSQIFKYARGKIEAAHSPHPV